MAKYKYDGGNKDTAAGRYIKTPEGAESHRRWKESKADPTKKTTAFRTGDWSSSVDKNKAAEERYIKTPEGAASYKRWKEAKADPDKITTDFRMGDWSSRRNPAKSKAIKAMLEKKKMK